MVGIVYMSEINKAHGDYISSLNFNPNNDNLLASACMLFIIFQQMIDMLNCGI
jgi:hypothetical protein